MSLLQKERQGTSNTPQTTISDRNIVVDGYSRELIILKKKKKKCALVQDLITVIIIKVRCHCLKLHENTFWAAP